jgi:hypothetical protein
VDGRRGHLGGGDRRDAARDQDARHVPTGGEHRRPAPAARPSSTTTAPSSWLRPHIRVRIRDAASRYYRCKAVVADVVRLGVATLLLDAASSSGASRSASLLLEDVRESQLETALPKPGGSVVVVRSRRHCGAVGELLQRDAGTETATVRLAESDDIVTLPMDDVAELVGGGAGADF